MNVGLPGTGIGGLFYIGGALWAPVDAAIRCATGRRAEVRWRLVARQGLLALGIIGALWVTGWGLGQLVAAIGPGAGTTVAAGDASTAEAGNVLRRAAILGSAAVLMVVLLAVQVLRFAVDRPANSVRRDALAGDSDVEVTSIRPEPLRSAGGRLRRMRPEEAAPTGELPSPQRAICG